ncbi:phage portal protein [Listeria fleischmannii]|uniref:phage portal protein n=1 Tax=Listeria fleischmannii TaxID=1069827 RepID=UPI001627CDCE|nr:phage portal protein [Listeria fleischmannii]MBC1420106.1 phage portal protein [Listeria fleischmannii]
MGLLDSIFKRNQELEWMYDYEYLVDTSQKAYLKRIALDTCIQFLARSIAQSDFQIRDGTKILKNDWYYKLNVRPNTDESSSTFWEKVIYKLVHDGECLIVLSNTDDLLIADSFERKEYAVYDDLFTGVTVKDYEFKKSFPMNQVFYLEYANSKLSTFIEGLFDDYGEIFGRMVSAQLRNYQLRAIVKIGKTGGSFDPKKQAALQAYLDKVYAAIQKSAVAIVPETPDFEYNELGATRATNAQSIDELTKLKKSMIDDVAKMLGIPPSLIHGEMADLNNSMKSFDQYSKRHFMRKIQDELNAKLFTPAEYLAGRHVKIINQKSPLESAEAADKLIASGAFNRNEVRDMYGWERADDPELDRYILTKNYQADEGGEDE